MVQETQGIYGTDGTWYGTNDTAGTKGSFWIALSHVLHGFSYEVHQALCSTNLLCSVHIIVRSPKLFAAD